MQNFNLAVFSALNAGSAPHLAAIRFGVFAADWLVYAVPALLLLTWVMGARPTRRQAIEAGVGACAALALAQVIGHFWYSPRPFVLGIGTQLIPHAPDGSFPSDHTTFVCSVAAGLLIASTTRAAGLALAVIAVVVGWGRIYVGVHWPLDIAGGALVGTAGALAAHLYGRPVTALLDRIGESVHAVAFTRLHERSIRID
ncbi:phosphoesterase [Burkholderia sp. ABCPW 14]|uniref:undecaprenyl-diphosphatase n=1 Tax=Burkholderia sp. ABCPW 14 TaxID=1637860 RepID=UPI000770D607|nr:undecaprenyl-diphosphatase [Burkholderia sp. ABCPW 14]KVD88675.1 phosphoesterase [Burkholderia sp. ABCPW 14]